MSKIITFKGKPLTLVGRHIKVGMHAPQFHVTTTDLKEFAFDDCQTSVKMITSFLSIDTPVCDSQVKEFNRRATNLSKDVTIIGISQDLPFAQKRFCELNSIDKVKTLSDYKTNSFGINYGLLIKELQLLARAVIIIDKNNIIRYIEIVGEATHAPDYEAALNTIKEVLKTPPFAIVEELPRHCMPCEAGTPPLTIDRIQYLLSNIKDWELIENTKLRKTYKYKDFAEAKYFVDLISIIAEEQGHHPNITISYNKVTITLTTHAIGGLSDNDFVMAQIIDELVVGS